MMHLRSVPRRYPNKRFERRITRSHIQTTKAANKLWHQIVRKIARQKKFGLAKRFQSTAEKSSLTEVQHVRVCQQRSPTQDSGAKNSATMKHVQGSAHGYKLCEASTP